MRTTLLRTPTYLFTALIAAFVFTWNPAPASSAVMNEDDSDSPFVEQDDSYSEEILLAKGQRKKVDDFPSVPRNKGRLGHPQPHKFFDDGSDDDFYLAKGRVGDDNPKRHIGPHKLMEDAPLDASLHAQARRRFDDNPTGPRRDDNPKRRFGPNKLIEDTANELILAKRGKVDDLPKPHPRAGHA